jgi:hypothetical protein
VEHKQNLNRREFDNVIHSFARNPLHKKTDMMILAILSHGRDGHVYASDGAVIGIESIYEKFNNQHCPALQGKPKFFIIQVNYFESGTPFLKAFICITYHIPSAIDHSLLFRLVVVMTPTSASTKTS